MSEYFPQIPVIRYEGPASREPLSFKYYNPNETILGKTMAEQLRFAMSYWHTLCAAGTDMFGGDTSDKSFGTSDVRALARAKAGAGFELMNKLGIEFYCFHDRDIATEGATLAETNRLLDEIVPVLARLQQEHGKKLLWGTANLFANKRYMNGAGTSPRLDVYAYAAAQIKKAIEITVELGGQGYVFWGGREGYETLLNTDLRQEREQIGRFMQLVVEHKHKIGFQGTLLIEPKPQEPTKHQYDYDASTVYGFLKQFGLEKEIKVNIEANHATLAGHSFHHEIASAIALGIFGSVDANRGDAQLGWDTDQFPNSVEENALVMYEIVKAGGFTTGGLNFDAKVRRQSTDKYDLFYGHIGAMDTMALALKVAARMIEDGELDKRVAKRYSGWNSELGQQILKGQLSLAEIAKYAEQQQLAPQHQSGHQELLENLVNHYLFDK